MKDAETGQSLGDLGGLTGTFGKTEIAVPRARLNGSGGKTTEWKIRTQSSIAKRSLGAPGRTAISTCVTFLTVISLPAEEDTLSAIVQALEGVLKKAQSAADIAQAKKYNPSVASALGDYADVDMMSGRYWNGWAMSMCSPDRPSSFTDSKNGPFVSEVNE